MGEGKNTYVQINEKYRLVFDKYCMWIEKHREAREKKDPTGNRKARDTWERASGYYTDIAELLISLERKEFLQIEEAKNLRALARKQAKMHQEIKKICVDLRERLSK